MKTAHEILLGRHRACEPKLDAIRQNVVAGMASLPEKSAQRFPNTLIEFLVSLRWHAAAISAVWLFTALLGLGGEHPGSTRGTMAGTPDTPPPLAYILALREYSRQLSETIEPPPRQPPAPVPHACAPMRRRETEFHNIV